MLGNKKKLRSASIYAFAVKYLFPLGVFFMIAPSIFEPQSGWRLGALWYLTALIVSLIFLFVTVDRLPSEGLKVFKNHKNEQKVAVFVFNTLRIFGFCLGILILWNFLYLVQDTYAFLVDGQDPITEVYTVEHADASLGGAWFIGQKVTISEKGGSRKEIFLHFSTGVQVGKTYEFTYFPRSREVIEYYRIR